MLKLQWLKTGRQHPQHATHNIWQPLYTSCRLCPPLTVSSAMGEYDGALGQAAKDDTPWVSIPLKTLLAGWHWWEVWRTERVSQHGDNSKTLWAFFLRYPSPGQNSTFQTNTMWSRNKTVMCKSQHAITKIHKHHLDITHFMPQPVSQNVFCTPTVHAHIKVNFESNSKDKFSWSTSTGKILFEGLWFNPLNLS